MQAEQLGYIVGHIGVIVPFECTPEIHGDETRRGVSFELKVLI